MMLSPEPLESSLDDLDPRRLARRTTSTYRPWTSEALTRAVLLEAAALIMIVVSWFEASGSATVRSQMSWLKLGLFGLVVAGLVNGLWLLRGRQLVGLARSYVLAEYGPASQASGVPNVTGPELMTDAHALRYFVAATNRYHRVECPLIDGKSTTAAAITDQVIASRTACELCRP